MKTATLFLVVVLGLTVPALAAPGDPRLIQGILEWPQSLDRYPVLLIRDDDGTLYFANIGSAERRGSPSAGMRVAILGVEGKHTNEVLAMFVTTSTVTEPTPSVAPTASGGTAATAEAVPPSVPGTPAAGADIARTTPSGPAASSAASGVPAPPAPAQPTSPPAGPAASACSQAELAAGSAVAAPPRNASPTTAAPPRWTEVQGIVVAIGYRTLVLKAEDGQRVVVDVSALRSGIASSALIGSVVKVSGVPIDVYGVPIDQRLKAAGVVEAIGRPR